MSELPSVLPTHSKAGAQIRMVVFDFDGVFTDNTVWTDSNGTESVRCWRGDGLGLRVLRELGIPTWVLSTETDPVVARRCAKLGVAFQQSLLNKGDALAGLSRDAGIALTTVAYVGNDVNDAACLSAVGVPIVVADAHPHVVPLARYRTQTAGGFGAVREVCDWIAASVRQEAGAPR